MHWDGDRPQTRRRKSGQTGTVGNWHSRGLLWTTEKPSLGFGFASGGGGGSSEAIDEREIRRAAGVKGMR